MAGLAESGSIHVVSCVTRAASVALEGGVSSAALAVEVADTVTSVAAVVAPKAAVGRQIVEVEGRADARSVDQVHGAIRARCAAVDVRIVAASTGQVASDADSVGVELHASVTNAGGNSEGGIDSAASTVVSVGSSTGSTLIVAAIADTSSSHIESVVTGAGGSCECGISCARKTVVRVRTVAGGAVAVAGLADSCCVHVSSVVASADSSSEEGVGIATCALVAVGPVAVVTVVVAGEAESVVLVPAAVAVAGAPG